MWISRREIWFCYYYVVDIFFVNMVIWRYEEILIKIGCRYNIGVLENEEVVR